MSATVESTGVTASGTPYTVFTEVRTGASSDRVRWAIADFARTLPNRHGVLYCHGSGSGADAFTTISQFRGPREFILDNGGFYVECYGNGTTRPVADGQQNWGRDFSKEAYRAAAQLVAGYISTVDWVVLGRSMGGLVGSWLATLDPYIAPLCVGLIHLSGIYDMLAEFDNGNHFNIPGYYGTPAGDRDALATATATNDPKRIAQLEWAGLNVCDIYGTADTTALPSINALALWADRQPVLGAKSKLVAVPGATHSQSGGTYGSPAQAAFLADVWNIVPPAPDPGTFYRAGPAYRVGPDGRHYPATI